MISEQQKAAIETYRQTILRLHAEKLAAEKLVDPTMVELLGRHDLATALEIEELLADAPSYWQFEAGRRVTALEKKDV